MASFLSREYKLRPSCQVGVVVSSPSQQRSFLFLVFSPHNSLTLLHPTIKLIFFPPSHSNDITFALSVMSLPNWWVPIKFSLNVKTELIKDRWMCGMSMSYIVAVHGTERKPQIRSFHYIQRMMIRYQGTLHSNGTGS